MQLAHISDIHVAENRQRQSFDPDYQEGLKASIESRSLLHAVVVRVDAEDKLWLVAGEQRLRAMTDMHELGTVFTHNGLTVPHGAVPYVTLGQLTELEAAEAELEENIRRRDLSMQEHAQAIQKLHNLRQAQAATRGETHSVAQTALEVTGRSDGSYHASVREALMIAENLDKPGVAKAKTAKEAIKYLKQEDQRERNMELAVSVGKTFSADLHRAHHGDSQQWAAAQASEQFDVILTDPPYGMGADGFGDGGSKLAGMEHGYEDSYEAWTSIMDWFCPESFRLAKPEAHAYVFCDIDVFLELRSRMELAGWYVFRTPLVIHKINSGRVPLPENGPRRSYEICLYAIKGWRKVNHIYPDVISSHADENLGFGAQKPVEVFQNLLQRSVRPGDRVLDLFAGTGPIFPAAHALQCSATGVELDAGRYGNCITRLAQLKLVEGGLGL